MAEASLNELIAERERLKKEIARSYCLSFCKVTATLSKD